MGVPPKAGVSVAGFANFYLFAYAVDAGVSLLHDLLRGVGVPPGIPELRNLIAALVVAASLLLFVWMALSPRWPKRVFLPPVLFVFWWIFGGFPMPLLADSPTELATMGSVIQVGVAAAAFLAVRHRTGGRSRFIEDDFVGPAFRATHTLLYSLGTGVVLLPFLMATSVMIFVTTLEDRTGGFVDFQRDGVHLTERVYGREDRRVTLVGMMHIGRGQSYRELFESFAEPSTVILQEGVTDHEGRLESGLDYEPLARALGLDVQLDPREVYGIDEETGESESEWPHVRHSDVDLAEFSEESIGFLAATSSLFAHEDPGEGLREFRDYVDAASPETWVRVEEDVLTSRNRVLIDAIDAALPEYENVVVPWGALHLPEVEEAVREREFVLRSTEKHLLFRWDEVADALRRFADRASPESPPTGAD